MTQQNRDIELTFKKLGHFWLDSGLIGLYEIACNIAHSNESFSHLKPQIVGDNLIFQGGPLDIENFLWECSKRLMD